MAAFSEAKPFKWVGGSLCLDFNNTVDWTGLEPKAGELLPSYERLVAWGHEAGVLSDRDRQRLLLRARKQPGAAGRALERAWAVRRTIHTIFFAVLESERPDPALLRRLNELLAEVPAQVGLAAAEPVFAWTWPCDPDDLACVLWPVVGSAAHLLTGPDLARLKTCANEECGWLFLDESRRHNRRWCEMGVCGNRAKARRFYARQKGRARQ